MKKVFLLVIINWFLSNQIGIAQDYTNKGTDFWAGYGYHRSMSNNFQLNYPSSYNSQDLVFYFTSDKDAIVTVDIPGIPGFTPQVYTVTANQVTISAPMPKTGNIDTRLRIPGQSSKGIHISSTVPIVAYAHIYDSNVSGASLLFPTATLGNDYYSINFTQYSNEIESNSFFFIIATEDNTSVLIRASAANLNGLPINADTIIVLNKGEIYNVMGAMDIVHGGQGADLTGSRIRSVSSSSGGGCKKIAVFSGSGKISIGKPTPSTGTADNLFVQSFPAVAWGKKYLTSPTGNDLLGQPNNYYRICVKDPNTVVKLNGVVLPQASLINGFYYQFFNSNQNGFNPALPNLIESDIPVLVAQYCTSQGEDGNSAPNGDPEMIYLSPVEQTINSITLYSASKFKIVQSYLNIIIKNQGVSSFTIDGVSQQSFFQTHPNEPNYSYAVIPVISGSSHTLYSDSGFNAIAYGFGASESYGYNAGTSLKDFNPKATIQNPYKRIDSAVTCVNTPFQISIPLNFLPRTIRWDFSAAPNIVPNTTVAPLISPVVYDSLVTSVSPALYYFSPQQTYQFINSNTSLVRDTIKLYTTSATPDGCGSTDQLFTIPVKVLKLPSANFTTNNSGCLIDPVQFLDATNTNGESIVVDGIWDFGDNTFVRAMNPTKKYALSGTYPIWYRPITNYGCIGDTTIKKSISDFPLALFSVADGCKNQTVKITDQSSAVTNSTIAKWYWDYGNGTKDTLTSSQARTVTYSDTGYVTISLTVESNSGCLSKVFKNSIHINPIPEPGFILPEVCQNDAVTQFFDTTKISDNSNNFKYEWNFNAASPAITPGPIPITANEVTSMNPKVKYFQGANYTVSEKVTSVAGCEIVFSQPFTVNGSNPNPDFEVLNSSALCSNMAVSIRNKSAMIDFGNVTRLDIYWDTNDLTKKSSIETPYFDSIYSYTYPNFQSPISKNYTIRLVAFSGAATSSCNKLIEKNITVLQSPKVSFSAIPNICSNAQPILIQGASFDNNVPNAVGSPFFAGTGIINSLTGLFDPTITGSGGSFTIKYESISDKGCIDSLSQTIIVWPAPLLELGPTKIVLENSQVPIKPQLVQGDQLQYLWSPATYLNSITDSIPISSPLKNITYKLVLTGIGNCSVTDSIAIVVLLMPIIPNAFSPNGDGINDTWKIQYLESYPGATIEVFNRYGQKVFSSLGYHTEWDGNLNGKPLPVGVYYYIINPKNGRPIFSGSVTIIK